ncbi:MAG TPA: hypothetical protein VF469_32765 [Kofleriaceae bacterium]
MRWIVSCSIVLVGVLTGCGGPQVPAHNGYKPKEAKPWKKPKALKFDDKMEAKADGDVSYPDMRRARWYEAALPSNGQLTISLEVTPPGDAVNDDFDLGLEVFDPHDRVISKSDLEDADAHELNKKKALVDLAPGKYLIHIFLQGRMDTAEYVLHAAFKPTAAAEAKSNFPADVKFVPALPMVPIQDDTPRSYRPPATTVTKVTKRAHPTPTATPTPTPSASINGRIIDMQIVAGGTQVIISRGTSNGASDGMKATLAGVSTPAELRNCKPQVCSATLKATPDQIRAANSMVTLTGP